MKDRISITSYDNDKLILKMVLSGIDVGSISVVEKEFRDKVSSFFPQSLLGLVSFIGLEIADEISPMMKELAEFSFPFFRAVAVLAKNDATFTLASSIICHFDQSNISVFQDEAKAREWLLTQ